jgi:hypothetical protein
VAQITNAHIIRAIELILFGSSPHYEARGWIAAGVECRRDRHRYTGEGYAFSLEILRFRPAAQGRSVWEAMIVTERWATGMPETVVRTQKWMKLVAGKPSELRAWVQRYRPARGGLSAPDMPEGANLDI